MARNDRAESPLTCVVVSTDSPRAIIRRMFWKDSIDEPFTNFIALLARILLAILFVQGGYNKLFGGTAGTAAYMASHGIPFPNILVWGAVVVELGIGLCLMAGLLARWAALILAAYTLALGLIFHAYWLAPAADVRFERIIFFNHLSIIGGMLAIVAFGAGCFSLDAAMGRKSA
jgi:putative oxidoreductase